MNSKKTQAQELYAQTALTKTEIAAALGIHRNTISTWVREGDWNRLKAAGQNLPSILAENCYHIMGHLTESYLSEWRLTDPITHKEADTLYKLACTIAKLRSRTTINETMEMMSAFTHDLRKQNRKLAGQLRPYVDKYLARQAKISVASLVPGEFTAPGGRIPVETPQETEKRQAEEAADNREAFFRDSSTVSVYNENDIPLPADMNPADFPGYKLTEPPQVTNEANETADVVGEAAQSHNSLHTAIPPATPITTPSPSLSAQEVVRPETDGRRARQMHNDAQSVQSQGVENQLLSAQNSASGDHAQCSPRLPG